MYKYLIFDIDGTILDTEKPILKSLQQALKEEGKYYPLEELKFALGIPGKAALKKLGIADVDRIDAKWSEIGRAYFHEITVYQGMETVLKKLSESHVKTGIVTSRTKQELMDDFEPFGLSPYFDCIISASDTERHKPHPEPLLACLSKLNAPCDEAVYIGDSIYDMQCAKNAGVAFGLAFWGAKTTEGLESADFVLKEPKEIFNLLKI